MAEKWTKADKLRINIERLERRDEGRYEPEFGGMPFEPPTLHSVELPNCTTLEELTSPGVGVKSLPNSPTFLGGEMKRNREHSDPQGPTPDATQLTDRISRRAYELFEARGREHGHDRQDWLQAEAEILAQIQTGTSIQEPSTQEQAGDRQAITATATAA